MVTQKLENMAEATPPYRIWEQRKAISALFPYAVYLARRGQREMLDAFSRVARASDPDSENFMWHHIGPFTMTLFDNPNPPSLNWILGLTSPRKLWHDQPHDNSAVSWPAAAPSYTGEADRGMVDEVLRVAADEVLRVAFINPRRRTPMRTEKAAVREVRALGDAGVLRSYLLLLWSKGTYIEYRHEDLAEMQISIWEGFGGIGMWRIREYLIERLDRFRWKPAERRWQAAEQCGELKRLFLEADEAAEKILTRMPPWSIHSGLLI